VMRPLSSLTPYSRNPRRNHAAIDRMVGSIREFGFKIPILAKSDGTVVDGHLRLKGAQRLGMTDVPVILCDEWSEAQVKAFRLMANRSVAWAEWDEELLALELSELQAMSFDLGMTGFDEDEITSLLTSASATTVGLTHDDSAPELPEKPITQPGDLWLLGNHHVLCGDTSCLTDVRRLMDAQLA